jgi:hypothetical protein
LNSNPRRGGKPFEKLNSNPRRGGKPFGKSAWLSPFNSLSSRVESLASARLAGRMGLLNSTHFFGGNNWTFIFDAIFSLEYRHTHWKMFWRKNGLLNSTQIFGGKNGTVKFDSGIPLPPQKYPALLPHPRGISPATKIRRTFYLPLIASPLPLAKMSGSVKNY